MTRTATFSGTILIVAGFVATAIAADPESSERRDRFSEGAPGIDGGFTAGRIRGLTDDITGRVSEERGVITIDIVAKTRAP
jgi:hypothetical protein